MYYQHAIHIPLLHKYIISYDQSFAHLDNNNISTFFTDMLRKTVCPVAVLVYRESWWN